MATSGTLSTTTFTTRKVIDRAFRRCQIAPETITAEHIDIATDNLFLSLSALVNRGIALWCIEKLILPTYQGQAQIELPLGTVDLLNQTYRTVTRLDGSDTSSAGGTVGNAFDDDFATACTQTSTLGNIMTDFTDDTLVTTVGLLPNASATQTLVFERSDDNSTWTSVYAPGSTAYVAGTWVWYDLDGNIAARYFRVRATVGTLAFREIYWGGTPTEIALARLNQDDYTNLPNKTFGGQPTQFWLNRLRGGSDSLATMYLWPVTDLTHRYDQLVVWRQRYIQDVGTLAQEVEVPQRWYRYVTKQLASDLAEEFPEQVDPARALLLAQAAGAEWKEAQTEERDNSPITFTPQIRVYTR